MRLNNRRTAVAAAVVVLGIGGGAAWASWIVTGTGAAQARAAAANGVSATAGVLPTTRLVPGGQGDMAIAVVNTNPFPVQVSTVFANGAVTADSAHVQAGCTTTGVTFPDPQLVEWVIGPNSTGQFTLPGAVKMSNASSSGCQGATFTIPIKLAATSNA